MRRASSVLVTLAALLVAGLATASPSAGAAPTSVVQAGDILLQSEDCSTGSSAIAVIQLGPAATSAQIGDDPGDQAGANANAVRWVDPGGTFYASIANCEAIWLFSGEGDEIVTVFGVDAGSSLVGIIVATIVIDTSVDPHEIADEPGADTVNVTAGADPNVSIAVISGSGDDLINVAPTFTGQVSVEAGDGNDRINTGAGDDIVSGDGGSDIINTRDGADEIRGGTGSDTINAGPGNDDVFGQGGNDTVFGNTGDDAIFGQGGDDNIFGGPGNDALRGGVGDDTMDGSLGNDALYGNDGSDTMNGGPGNDRMRGQANPDIVFGSSGNDLIIGGGGKDTHNGGTDFDRCFEGANQGLTEIYISCEVT